MEVRPHVIAMRGRRTGPVAKVAGKREGEGAVGGPWTCCWSTERKGGKGWMSKLRPRVQTRPHKYKMRKELDEKGAWESSSDRLLRLAALEHVWPAKQGPMT